MSTDFIQEHYEIVRIELPYVDGVCTLNGVPGFNTALTCEQPANSTKVYSFASQGAPMIAEGEIYSVISGISETPAKIQPERGLASRGTISINFVDFIGDPNRESQGFLDNPSIEDSGTYFGKLNARNILQNKTITVELHTKSISGNSYPNPNKKRTYIVESFTRNNGGSWTLKGKDVLSSVNFDESQYPENETGALRADIDNTTTTIPVDNSSIYEVGKVMLINDEFMYINAVSGIGTGSAEVTVNQRGLPIGTPEFTKRLTKTRTDDHSQDDTITICRVSNAERIDDLLEDILLSAGVDANIVAASKPAWTTEVDEWLPSTTISTIWRKPEDTDDILKRILTDFMLDMWFDQDSETIKLTAVSEWRQSSQRLEEGSQINYESFKVSDAESYRATRAIAVYNKVYLSDSDSVEKFGNIREFLDSNLESAPLYGKKKVKRFDNSELLDDQSASLLTGRYIRRFGTQPISYRWQTEEKNLNFSTGDVVNPYSVNLQNAQGLPEENARAQILTVKPKYTKTGRLYDVEALTYAPEFDPNVGDNIIINQQLFDVNLWRDFLGSPLEPDNFVLIFDNCRIGATSTQIPAMINGNLPAGSTMTIIFLNGTDLQGKGGQGAAGQSAFVVDGGPPNPIPASTGQDGGICFNDSGVPTTIWLFGNTGIPSLPNADGYLRAPGGGGGAGLIISAAKAGSAGGGGAGNQVGPANVGGIIFDSETAERGESSESGTITGDGGNGGTNAGNGGDWGQAGQDAGSNGGRAGKGLSGTITTIEGATAARFINGIGEAPV